MVKNQCMCLEYSKCSINAGCPATSPMKEKCSVGMLELQTLHKLLWNPKLESEGKCRHTSEGIESFVKKNETNE